MVSVRRSLLTGCVCLAVVVAGCQKKTTKIDESAQADETPIESVDRTESEIVPSDEDVFETVDLDEQMKEIFVPVYFEYDQYTLEPAAIEKLERIANFLVENESVRILIEGHADERGTHEYNIGLGENRAKAAREYLIGYGIKPVRLEYTSYGRERPAKPGCMTDECHELNRRVEWKRLKK